MALQASQSSQSARSCMPLAKFSYATVPAGSLGPIPWTHISSQNDLFVILDPYEVSGQTGIMERRYRFKVLQDPNAREDIDLYLLATEARRAIAEAQSAQIPGQQPFISIIVKNPCVAMRYPLQDRQVRRFQVRFAREEDFYETLKVFAGMKVPFVEAGAMPPALNPVASSSARPETFVTSTDKSGRLETSDVRTPLLPHPHGSGVEQRTADSSVQPHNSYNAGSAVVPCAQSFQCMPFSMSQPNPIGTTIKANPGINNSNQVAVPFFQTHQPATMKPVNQISSERALQLDQSASTFVSRPWTAPVSSTTALDPDLPPKRDLPFERKTKTLDSLKASHETQKDCPAITTTEMSADRIAEPSQQLGSNTTGQQTKKGNKRAASKPKKTPAAKKSRKTTPRTKGTGSEAQDQDSTQDTSKLNESQLDDGSGAQSRLDTQVLLDRAEAIQAARQAEFGIPTPNNHLANQEPPQPVRYLPQPTKQPSHTHTFTNTKASELSTHPDPQPNATCTPNHNPHKTTTSHQTALAALLSKPDFAQISLPQTENESGINFDDLTEQQKHEALESFIVQNLEDERFVQLCKTLEGVWQRIFVRI